MDPPHPAAAVEEVLDSGASSDFTFEAGSGGGTDAGDEAGNGGGDEAGEAGNGGGDEAEGDEMEAATRSRVTRPRVTRLAMEAATKAGEAGNGGGNKAIPVVLGDQPPEKKKDLLEVSTLLRLWWGEKRRPQAVGDTALLPVFLFLCLGPCGPNFLCSCLP